MAAAPDPDYDYKVEVLFKDNDIVGIKFGGVLGSTVSQGDINRYKHSPYGLRLVDSVSYTQEMLPLTEQDAETLTTNCYMIIGGFKVKIC